MQPSAGTRRLANEFRRRRQAAEAQKRKREAQQQPVQSRKDVSKLLDRVKKQKMTTEEALVAGFPGIVAKSFPVAATRRGWSFAAHCSVDSFFNAVASLFDLKDLIMLNKTSWVFHHRLCQRNTAMDKLWRRVICNEFPLISITMLEDHLRLPYPAVMNVHHTVYKGCSFCGKSTDGYTCIPCEPYIWQRPFQTIEGVLFPHDQDGQADDQDYGDLIQKVLPRKQANLLLWNHYQSIDVIEKRFTRPMYYREREIASLCKDVGVDIKTFHPLLYADFCCTSQWFGDTCFQIVQFIQVLYEWTPFREMQVQRFQSGEYGACYRFNKGSSGWNLESFDVILLFYDALVQATVHNPEFRDLMQDAQFLPPIFSPFGLFVTDPARARPRCDFKSAYCKLMTSSTKPGHNQRLTGTVYAKVLEV
eukprot:GILJ01014154.1.p1 GENE.GILJ01014154.1~~GILJ01014154.1.p1  ORF type:complete len:419 (-),score=26.46 GILJ01014154.1:746-2002(-)